uniref:Uncharacterized protein n=2 Tax=Enterobacteriaceae TaxID=543 RepID=Q6I6B8_ECOLX|nr:hypothetical protein [Escherichia coli]BAF93156.1 hypothetical protein [Salmonella enterica subsp. enterica serovar Dublin]FAA00048.1 TPA: hypothetical protein [Escherichia coli]
MSLRFASGRALFRLTWPPLRSG